MCLRAPSASGLPWWSCAGGSRPRACSGPSLPPDQVKGPMMRACGVSSPGGTDVALLELPEPPLPGPGQVLIAVEAAGVGPWDPLLNTGGWDVGLRPPAALGVEGVGRVHAVGAGVQGLSVGDRVVAHEAPLPGGSGFWAQYVLVTAAHAARLPSG